MGKRSYRAAKSFKRRIAVGTAFRSRESVARAGLRFEPESPRASLELLEFTFSAGVSRWSYEGGLYCDVIIHVHDWLHEHGCAKLALVLTTRPESGAERSRDRVI